MKTIEIMKTLNPISIDEANENSKLILESINKKIGMIPNLYAAMGTSDKLLGGFLTFQETIKSGEFTNKEYEAIALATSQANSCNYCLSAHTTLGKMNGFSEEETLNIRTNTVADSKLNALVTLASEISESKGHPSQKAVDTFFNERYSKAAFAELIAAIALTTITNYVFHNGGFEIDFPVAQPVEMHPEI